MTFTTNIATLKMDIVNNSATLKMRFANNCDTLKNTEIIKETRGHPYHRLGEIFHQSSQRAWPGLAS